MAHPVPAYQLVLNEEDLTSRISPRLTSLNLTLCRAEEADQLDVVLDDHDGMLAIPERGVSLAVSLGWAASGLVQQGTFIVDEVEHSGAPDVIAVRARSAPLSDSLHTRREQSWHQVSLATIVQTIAARHRLTPKVAEAFSMINLDHIDQTHESDLSFLTRLAQRYDAVMTVKQDVLLFMPIGTAQTVSGEPLPVIDFTRQDMTQHRYHIAQRENYAGVRAYWHSLKAAQRQSVIVGGDNRHNLKVLPEQYATRDQAQAAAQAEWQRIQRSQATLSLSLAMGRADCFPEMPVRLTGFKPEIDQTSWLIARVTHTLNEAGYSTALECEVQDDPASARHRRQFRQGKAR